MAPKPFENFSSFSTSMRIPRALSPLLNVEKTGDGHDGHSGVPNFASLLAASLHATCACIAGPAASFIISALSAHFFQSSYAGYRFPPEIIQHTIWLYI